MGIVYKQSLNNTVITFIGFAIGGLNTMFLYTNFMSDEYYGLIGVILSTATLLMPLMAFGVPNTIIKFFSSYTKTEEKERFLSSMLFLPLLAIIPLFLFSLAANTVITNFISKQNPIVKDYFWYIFIIGIAMAYFEVFYAWSKVHLKSVFGNFMKEVFVRAGVTVLLVLLYLKVYTIDFFLMGLVGLYILRVVIIKLYAFSFHWPKLSLALPKNIKSVLVYSLLIILGASASTALTEIDKFMINLYIPIEFVAYYSVAVYMARVIIVPSRSMHQITYPLTAAHINKREWSDLEKLYKKSSTTLLTISWLLFLLIVVSLKDLYTLLPAGYELGVGVVFLIGLTKVFDSFLGNNNAILYSSDYYKTALYLGVLLAVVTVLLNIWFLPKYGIMGAAWATTLAIFGYNLAKLIFVKMKFGMLPYSKSTLKVCLIALATGAIFYILPLPFNAILNIIIRTGLVGGVFMFAVLKLNVSPEITAAVQGFLKRKTP